MDTLLTQPHAVLIEDRADDAELMSTELRQLGWTVAPAASIVAGYQAVQETLGARQSIRPVIVICDMQLQVPPAANAGEAVYGPEGWALLGDIYHAMQDGTLHSAHLVAISADMTEQRQSYALAAGCTFAWQKPLQPAHYRQLADLVAAGPPSVPQVSMPNPIAAGSAQQTFLHMCRMLIATLRSLTSQRPAPSWTEQEILWVLKALWHGSRDHDREAEARALARLGGAAQARRHLADAAPGLHGPLRRMLEAILDSHSPQEVANLIPCSAYWMRQHYVPELALHLIPLLPAPLDAAGVA